MQQELAEGSLEAVALNKAAELLGQVLVQDITRGEDGPQLREGVAKDRMPSVHDPEMRHGRKRAQERFDGHLGRLVSLRPTSRYATGLRLLWPPAP